MRYNARVFSLLGQSGSIFGISLFDQVQTRTNLLVLSADMSTTAGLDKFKAKYPDRFVNVGIAEQNMIGIAAGLTDEGWKTVSVTQACFISMRCFEQIRQYCGYMGGKQIIVGLASGFSLSFLGNTHYALEDIALMRTIPGMTVIAAADAMEAVKIFEAALDENHPVYIRLYGGTNTPVVYPDNFEYKIGKAIKLEEGNDIQLIATGSMVYHALNVSKALGKEGIKASVVDMHTIKPLDTSVIDLNARLIVTLEEHFITGGLGSAVADFLSEKEEHPALYKIGVNDSFTVVGDYEFLMKSNHLDDESIIDTIMGQLKGGKMSLSVITDRGERLRSEELDDELIRFGKHIEKRSLMFCLCKNELGSLVGYLGAMKNKVVPVMLDAAKDSALMKHLLDIYRPNYIWAPRDSIVVHGQPCYTAYGYALYKYDDRPAKLNEDLALLLTTSGSTGSPKLVRLSYENILSNAESIAEYLHIDENERPVSSLPMHYSFGLSVINSHYVKGATLLLTDQPVIQKKFWKFIQEEKATSMAGVPFTYEMLRRLKIFQMNLPYMKTMIQAGGKLEVQLVQEYVDHCLQCEKEFIVMYGQTEASPRMSYLPWKYAKAKPSSIGIAIPKGKFSLIDAHDKEITKPDIEGELIYEGPNVCLGYAECREDLQKGDENQGILHTGDVARRDVDGFYYITGRMKRFVKLFGNRVNLDATEQLLKSVTLDVACVGVDDKLTTFITDASKLKSVKRTLVQKTGLNMRAFDVRVIDAIPKKSSGKLDYNILKEML